MYCLGLFVVAYSTQHCQISMTIHIRFWISTFMKYFMALYILAFELVSNLKMTMKTWFQFSWHWGTICRLHADCRISFVTQVSCDTRSNSRNNHAWLANKASSLELEIDSLACSKTLSEMPSVVAVVLWRYWYLFKTLSSNVCKLCFMSLEGYEGRWWVRTGLFQVLAAFGQHWRRSWLL